MPVCGLVFIAEAPADLDRYYPTESYQLPDTKRRLEATGGTEKSKLDLICPYRAGGDLLEVGSEWAALHARPN